MAAHGAEPASSLPTPAPHFVVGLSPFLPHAVKDEVYRQLVGFLLEEVPLGGTLGLYDAYHLRTITQFEVPNMRAFRSGKTRANQFKDQVRKLREFLADEPARPKDAKFGLDQAVRLPQFLDFVGENLVRTGRPLVVIVLGSPLYLDPREPAFSMVDGYFPSDGHLTASREQSVYGLKSRAGALKEVSVHFAYFGDPWVSEVHQEKIARFWSLYIQGQGGRLATFCGDLPTAFQAVRNHPGWAPTGRHYELDATQNKIEMLRITRDLRLTDWITQDVLANVQLTPPANTIGPMKIGIRWRGNIDLDLYARANDHAERLYFEHTRCAEGYYFKDYRTSPDREFEFIEFEAPVDVRQVSAMINFYKGNAPGGPTGEIRIEFEGKIFTGRFAIAAEHGNEGREGHSQEAFWTRIDIPRILRLPELRAGPGPARE